MRVIRSRSRSDRSETCSTSSCSRRTAPLYTLLAWPLVHVSEALSLVRLPAAVAGILAVPAMYWAGSELIGRRTALIGAFLLAISPAAVYYSQIARAYVLVVLFSSLSYGALASALRTGSRWWWVCYALALAAAGYSNALAIGLLVIAQAVMVLPRGRPRVVRWIAAGALTAVIVAPLAVLLYVETERRDALYYLSRPGMRSIRYWLGDVSAGHADHQPAAAYAILLVTVCILAYTLWRGRAALRPVRSLAHHRLTPIVAWAFAPPLVAFLISQIHPVFAPPYVICALPGTVLLVAACLERAPKTVGVAGLLTIVVLGGYCIVWQSTNPTTADYRRAARWLDERRNPTDPILIDDIGGLGALGYYARSLRAPNGWLAVKEWHDTPLPAVVTGLSDPGGYSGAPPGPPTPKLIAELVGKTGRLFVIVTDTYAQGDVPNGHAIGWARRTLQRPRPTAPPPRRHRGLEL